MSFSEANIADRAVISEIFIQNKEITQIIHLAAQPGVRHSLVDPYSYIEANVMGHLVMLEAARSLPRLQHFLYASSSSVYGGNSNLPYREDDRVDHPISLYAATKRADELISEAYGHIFGLPQTGLRFFTVYGPWGRPDMAPWLFADAILAGRPITLYEGGHLKRDFTFVADIAAGVLGALD
ncbi:MAG: NAD-dependent epimerase/dehydratase family protein, partial [bacterium]